MAAKTTPKITPKTSPSRPQTGGIPAPPRYPRTRTADLRTRHLLGDVERALLLQIVPRLVEDAADPGRRSSRVPAKMPVSSISAMVMPSSSRWSCTTTPPTSNRSRGRQPASAASCAMSSRWARARRQSECATLRRSRSCENPPSRRRVVAGIAHYGNCTGVPTIGGETNFDAGYDNNILVNAMCVGLAKDRQDFLFGCQGRRPAGRLRWFENRPRRHPRRDDGLG